MNRRLLIPVVLLSALAITAVVLFLRAQPLTVGVQTLTINHPLLHAVEGGFFAREGLKPRIQQFGSANDALSALLGGSIFVDATIPIQNIATVNAKQQGALGMFAVLLSDKEHPLDYLVVPSRSNIRSAQDLSGKRILVFPGSFAETVTRLALERVGVRDVNFVKRPLGDMQDALTRAEADAGVIYDPLATRGVAEGWLRIIEAAFWENHLLPTIVIGGYAYNTAEARKKPELTRRVFAALKAAILDARRNPRTAKRAIGKYLQVSGDILDRVPGSRVELPDEIDPNLIRATLELYARAGIVSQATDLTDSLYRP